MTDNPYTLSSVLPATNRPRKRWVLPVAIAALAAVLILATAVTIVLVLRSSLALRDPAGARACDMLRAWQVGDIKEDRFTLAAALGDLAAESSTDSIRKAGGEPIFDDDTMKSLNDAGIAAAAANLRLANARDLHAACVAEGVDMPPWTAS